MNKTAITRQALTPKEAAQYVGLSVSTLRRMRIQGVGIPYIKTGENNSAVRYPISALNKFLEKQQRTM
ncbi:MAG: helix-turn-helix domain-containing protein [Campylobacteraceae bacterium]|jgi:excisionase family DNA binding protein|nr:helix-turn-helix domain-containing protein [Campylobacteraceae bacterium]